MDKKAGYGREKSKVNVGSAQETGSSLAGAVKELHSQHPYNYDDHGPHHNTSDHMRHKMPVKPC